MKEEKTVSVIIPVFNRKKVVEETLNSIMFQSFNHWEAIVVDDGSTDGTIEILKQYELKDSRIKFFTRNRQPKGAQSCRNIGLKKSKGDYIIFLDSDDLMANYCLDQRIRYMNESPKLDFAVFPIIVFDKEPGDTLKLWNIFTEENDLDRFLRYDVVWQTSSPIYRREFVSKLKWDEMLNSGQDWDFHVGALALNPYYKKVDTLPDCFIRRDNNDRISYRFFDPPEILNRQSSLQKNFDLLKKNTLWKQEYNISYAVLYFSFSKVLVKNKNSKIDVVSFYKPVLKNKWVSTKDYIITLLYLLALKLYQNSPEKRKSVRKYFSRYLPKYLSLQVFNVTQEKVELKGIALQEFLKNNEKINTNNNQFNFS